MESMGQIPPTYSERTVLTVIAITCDDGWMGADRSRGCAQYVVTASGVTVQASSKALGAATMPSRETGRLCWVEQDVLNQG